MLIELEDRSGQRQRRLISRHTSEALPFAHALGQILAVHLVEQWLVIKQIELRRAAGHEEVNDPFCLRLEVRLVEYACKRIRCPARAFARKQCAEREAAETEGGIAQERAATIVVRTLRVRT